MFFALDNPNLLESLRMDHQIEDLLEHWLPLADDAWVLAVITHVQGSAYRKPGA